VSDFQRLEDELSFDGNAGHADDFFDGLLRGSVRAERDDCFDARIARGPFYPDSAAIGPTEDSYVVVDDVGLLDRIQKFDHVVCFSFAEVDPLALRFAMAAEIYEDRVISVFGESESPRD